MPLKYIFRPIITWPGKQTTARLNSRFQASFVDTLQQLEREVDHLDGRDVVIQAMVKESDLRLDGMIRANAVAVPPPVILSFVSKHGPLSYPCDTFIDWRANLRAIVLSLEHLRAVDRYGVTQRGEQYRGWAQLPPAKEEPNHAVFLLQAAGMLADASSAARVKVNAEFARHVWLAAIKRHHPDTGGSADEFAKVQAAKEALGI